MEMQSLAFTNVCRICLALGGGQLSIYDTKGLSPDSGTIYDMLQAMMIVPPSMNDGKPEKVCLDCLIKIDRCYSFRKKCFNNYYNLKYVGLMSSIRISNYDDDSQHSTN